MIRKKHARKNGTNRSRGSIDQSIDKKTQQQKRTRTQNGKLWRSITPLLCPPALATYCQPTPLFLSATLHRCHPMGSRQWGQGISARSKPSGENSNFPHDLHATLSSFSSPAPEIPPHPPLPLSAPYAPGPSDADRLLSPATPFPAEVAPASRSLNVGDARARSWVF